MPETRAKGGCRAEFQMKKQRCCRACCLCLLCLGVVLTFDGPR